MVATKTSCEKLARRVAVLCGSPNFGIAFLPQKPGYDVTYVYIGCGLISLADASATIGKPDAVYDKGANLAWIEQDWIYVCTDGEACVEVKKERQRNAITIDNNGVHSRSR